MTVYEATIALIEARTRHREGSGSGGKPSKMSLPPGMPLCFRKKPRNGRTLQTQRRHSVRSFSKNPCFSNRSGAFILC